MPTYSYKCPTCGNAFDIVQAFTDETLTVCDVCGNTLRKVFSPIGVSFTGSGFYRTDSRPAQTTEGASASSDSGSGSSDSGTKSDSGSTSDSGSKSDSGSGSSGGATSTPAAKPAAKPATTGASTS